MTFDTAYLKLKPRSDMKRRDMIKQVQLYYGSRISWENREDNHDPHFAFERIFYQKIKNNCKIVKAFFLVKTTLLVAFGKHFSFYNILEEKWMQ